MYHGIKSLARSPKVYLRGPQAKQQPWSIRSAEGQLVDYWFVHGAKVSPLSDSCPSCGFDPHLICVPLFNHRRAQGPLTVPSQVTVR